MLPDFLKTFFVLNLILLCVSSCASFSHIPSNKPWWYDEKVY